MAFTRMPALHPLDRQRPRQLVDPGLGRVVGRLALRDVDDERRHRADVDDAPRAAGREDGPGEGLAGEERPGQVDVEHPAPLGRRHVLGLRPGGDAGGVDEDRRGTQLVDDPSEDGGQGRVVGDVGVEAERRDAASLAQPRRGGADAVADVEQRHRTSHLGQRVGHLQAQAAGAARHHGHLVVEVLEHGASLSRGRGLAPAVTVDPRHGRRILGACLWTMTAPSATRSASSSRA